MIRLRSRLTFANVTASIALFIALGAGAYAAQSIHKDSITVNKLDFPIGADGSTTTGKLTSNGSFQTVAHTKVRIDDRGAVMLVNGDINVDNTATATPAEVSMRMLMNGKPEDGLFTTTIPASAAGSGLAFFVCNESPGTYTVELQAKASGVTFTDTTLGVETAPQI